MLNELDEAGVIDDEGEAVKCNGKGNKERKKRTACCVPCSLFLFCVSGLSSLPNALHC